MNRRIPVALAATAALGVSALAIGPAVAAPAKKNRIAIVGGQTYKPGFYAMDNLRFAPRTITVRSGATVKVVNKGAGGEPHTVSFVSRSQEPRTKKSIDACGNLQGGVCLKLAQAHQANPQTGEVKVPVVDVGRPGVDRAGDSYYLAPGKGVSFKVTARKGATLRYFCVIHPWMQGTIKVR
jgi:plastocyanin